VRAAPDSLLDVARGTFSTLTQAVHDLAASYRAETALPALRVQYSAARGFTLLLPDSSSTGGGSRRGGRVPGTNATSGAHRQGLPR
jgi:MutS family domain IV